MILNSNLLEIIENCYQPKLSRNYEESESHPEFQKWESNISEHFPRVLNAINDLNLMDQDTQSSVLSSILLLYFQLTSKGQWNMKDSEEWVMKLDYRLELLCGTTCSNLLETNKVKTQDVFDKSIETLHQRLSADEFKKYPAFIEAYCLIIKDVNGYNVVLKPVSVLPFSIILIEDYVNENRKRGLEACSSILKSLTAEHFKHGNYYEVIYRVLKKTIIERDLEVTKLVLECLFDLLHILPPQTQVSSTVDDVLETILEQLYTETNLYRKKTFFSFINRIIPIHGVHCVKRTMFMTVICDNLDICSNIAVRDILFTDVLECLENWIRYCWCVWKLAPNKKLMSTLIKILYVYKDGTTAAKIVNIFLTLCKLCTDDERKEIYNNIEKSVQDIKILNERFAERLEVIKGSII